MSRQVVDRALEDALRAELAASPPERPGSAVTEAFERAEREGLVDVAVTVADTPVGEIALAATPRGLVRLALPGFDLDRLLEELAAELSPRILEHRRRLEPALRQLEQYFDRRRTEFDLDLDWALVRGGFTRAVLEATAEVPAGQTRSYAEVAELAGSRRASRAAGNALGSNPIAIVVPCHRVLATGGGLGGYAGGLALKRRLLELEGAL